jgi:hypothetical protein
LRHVANSQFTLARPVAVEQINGVPIRSLDEVVSAFEANRERFHRLEFEGMAGIEALEREKADAAHAEILKQYAIRRDRNL